MSNFSFTKPNSTPAGVTPLTVPGVQALSSVGTLTPSVTAFQAPQLLAPLTGVSAIGLAGSPLALPNIVYLTGVQAVGHLSDDTGGAGAGAGSSGPGVIMLTGIRSSCSVGYFGGAAPAGIPNVLPVSALNIPAIMKALQVPGGPCQNAFYVSHTRGAINWYQANVGLLSIVQFLSGTDLDTYIRPYLDCYVSRLNGDFSISDVTFNAGPSDLTAIGTQTQTADDSYASTFIRLVCRYTLASQNFAWFDTNRGTLLTMMDNMVFNNQRADGLIASFAAPRRNTTDVAYLRNNCEDWAALNDLANLLNQRNDNFNAARYSQLASQIGANLNKVLWQTAGTYAPGFKAADADAVLATTFNPNVLAHAYPQALGVAGVSGLYASAYAFINRYAAGWENCGYDPQPCLVIGLTAAFQGDTVRAGKQTATFETIYTNTPDTTAINELGMYQRIKSVLAGLPPT